MKKIFLLSFVLLIVCAVNAQTEFSVPTPTMEEKYNTTKSLLNNVVLAVINVSKTEGMTAQEIGKQCSELFIPLWDTETGFEQFVNFMLDSWACLGEGVQIVEQSNEKVVVIVSSVYQQLEDQGVFLGSSIEEYTAFYNAMMSEIAIHFDLTINMTWGEEGMKMEFTQ